MLEFDPIRQHWDNPATESMYDKHWAAAERRLISLYIPPKAPMMLDAGCGEGEGTFDYATLPGVGEVHGVDYSATRLALARKRCAGLPNVFFTQADFLAQPFIGSLYECVISARLLINFNGWDEQRAVLDKLIRTLKPGGRLLLMEGSKRGQEQLNAVRRMFGLPDITEQWHNVFLDDDVLDDYLYAHGITVNNLTGFGAFFLLTRGIQPAFATDKKLAWDSAFNEIAASPQMAAALPLHERFSRIRLWVGTKNRG